MSSRKINILNDLVKHDSFDEEEEQFRLSTIEFIEKYDEVFERSNLVGHLTGSAWILNESRTAILLIKHKKLNLWLQPGGHIDKSDESVLSCALREAKEETGIENINIVRSEIFDVDVHTIPARKDVPEHLHYDIRYLFVAQEAQVNIRIEEVLDYQWVRLDDALFWEGCERSVGRMWDKGQRINNCPF